MPRQSTRSLAAGLIVILLSIAFVDIPFTRFLKGIMVWPFSSSHKMPTSLFENPLPDWLVHAEVRPWSPDANLKPLKYFAIAEVSDILFSEWASGATLQITTGAGIPAGMWKLPKDLSFEGWPASFSQVASIEAQGEIKGGTVYARWSAGKAYVTIHRSLMP